MEATQTRARASLSRRASRREPSRSAARDAASSCAAASSADLASRAATGAYARAAVRKMRAVRLGGAAGLGSCITWVVLQESVLTLGNVTLFNLCLYACLGQVASYLALAYVGAIRDYRPTSALVRAAGIAGAASLPLQLAPASAVAIAGALLMGAASGVLLTTWGMHLSSLGARRSFILVLGSFLIGMLAAGACFFAQGAAPVLEYALGIALPLIAAFAPQRGAAQRRAKERISLPWPFLLTLAASCLLGSFFQGVATSPYAFQSDAVTFHRLVWAAGALAVLLLAACVLRCPKTQVFFLAVLVMLVTGLFLFSAGMLGSIIMPLGMILAARTCCFAFALITLSVIARTSGLSPTLVIAGGLALCDGTLGKGAGLLVSGYLQPSFPDLALAASVCIVAFTLLYAVLASVLPGVNDALDSDLDKLALTPEEEARALAERRMEALGLTPKERETARLILDGLAYAEIAEHMGTKERTVKFHAINVFKKASVANRNEFAALMRVPDDDGGDGGQASTPTDLAIASSPKKRP